MKNNNSKLTYLVISACFMLLVFGISIGHKLTRTTNPSIVNEPLLGDTTCTWNLKNTTESSTPPSNCKDSVSSLGTATAGATGCVSKTRGGITCPCDDPNKCTAVEEDGVLFYSCYKKENYEASCTTTTTCYKYSSSSNSCSAETVSGSSCNNSNNYYDSWQSCRNNIQCGNNQYIYGNSCMSCGENKRTVSTSCQGNSAECCEDNVTTVTCSAGKFLPAQSTTCENCPAGYYCPGGPYPIGDSSPNGIYPCTGNNYSTGGASSCSACSTSANETHTGCTALQITDIQLSCPTTMTVGETKIINPTITPTTATNKSLEWSTNDPEGLEYTSPGESTSLKAVYTGNYTLTATARDGSGVKGTCSIKVVEASKRVTGITVNKSSATVTAGQSTSVTFTVNPSDASNKTINWTSNNTAVATVTAQTNVQHSTITINGIKAGTATITGRAQDGSNKTVTIDVTVKDKYEGYSIYIDRNQKIYLAKSEDSTNVTVQVKDSAGNSASNEPLTYTSSKGYVDLAFSATEEGAAYGAYIVTTSNGKANATNSNTVTDTVTVCLKNSPSICNTYTVYIYCSKWTQVNSSLNVTIPRSSYPDYLGIEAAHVKNTCYYFPSSSCTITPDASTSTSKVSCTRYFNRCCGSSAPVEPTPVDPTPVEPTYYCYANAEYIEDATEANWQTGPSGNLTHIIYGLTDGTCLPSACYGNAATLDKATHADWFMTGLEPTGYTKYPNISRDNCVINESGCYGDGPTIETSNIMFWSEIKVNGYTKLDVNRAQCNREETDPEVPACYLKSDGQYIWGTYQTSLDYIKQPISNKDDCDTPTSETACYKNANGYYWGHKQSDSDVIVADVSEPNKCRDPQTDACYINNTNGKYVWGPYQSITGYTLVSDIRSASLCTNEKDACYKHKTSGNYVWGKFATNSDFTLVGNVNSKGKCNNDIIVPQTAASVQTIVYVFVVVLVTAGLVFVYYAFYKNKKSLG